MLLWFLLRFRRFVPSQFFFCLQLRCHKVHRAPDDPLCLVIQSTGPSLGQLMATLPFAGSPFRAQMPCCAAATLRSMFHGGATCETQATATGSGGSGGNGYDSQRFYLHSHTVIHTVANPCRYLRAQGCSRAHYDGKRSRCSVVGRRRAAHAAEKKLQTSLTPRSPGAITWEN